MTATSLEIVSHICLAALRMSQPKQVMNARGLLEDRRRSELMFREGYWKSYGERFFVRNMTRG